MTRDELEAVIWQALAERTAAAVERILRAADAYAEHPTPTERLMQSERRTVLGLIPGPGRPTAKENHV